MKKLFQKGILLLTSFFLTSCSNPFFGGGEGSSISEVTHVYDDKSGNTIVTIRFVDEDLEPVTFVIPRGITGQDGNGIRNIKAEPSMDNKSITLTISFTDPDNSKEKESNKSMSAKMKTETPPSSSPTPITPKEN